MKIYTKMQKRIRVITIATAFSAIGIAYSLTAKSEGKFPVNIQDSELSSKTESASSVIVAPESASPVTFHNTEMPNAFHGLADNIISGSEYLSNTFNLIARRDTVVRILQIGDSHVRGHYFPGAVRSTLEEAFGNQATGNDVISYRNSCIATETGEPGIVYSAIGINGATTSRFLENDKIEEIKELKPNLVVISFGTNESCGRYDSTEHTRVLDSLISRLSAECNGVQFLLTTPPGSYKSVRSGRTYRDRRGRKRYAKVRKPNETTSQVASTIVKYGKDNNIAVWDMYNIAGGESNACTNWRNAGLMNKDQIHYTMAGYKLQGQMLGEAIIKAYNKYVEH